MHLKIAPGGALLPDRADGFDSLFPDPLDFAQTHRSMFDHIQSLGAEAVHDRLGLLSAEPLDNSGREIFYNPFGSHRQGVIIGKYAELASVILVDLPSARRLNPLPRGDTGKRSHDRMAGAGTIPDQKNRIGVVIVFIDDLLDLSPESLFGHAVGRGIRKLERRIGNRKVIHDGSLFPENQWCEKMRSGA